MYATTEQLERLYREMGPALLVYFRQHRAVASDAEDLLQDTFVRAFRHFDRLQQSISPRAYLFGIARHVCLDALRRRKSGEETTDEAIAPINEPEDLRLQAMRDAIGELPALQREALLLKLRHELSYEEIAEVLAVPVGTVRSRLHHAVRQLKENLNPAKPVLSPPSP